MSDFNIELFKLKWGFVSCGGYNVPREKFPPPKFIHQNPTLNHLQPPAHPIERLEFQNVLRELVKNELEIR